MKDLTRLKLARSAKKQARHKFVCVCGRICAGNGGWSSHKHGCHDWRKALMEGRVLIESTRDEILCHDLRNGRQQL